MVLVGDSLDDLWMENTEDFHRFLKERHKNGANRLLRSNDCVQLLT